MEKLDSQVLKTNGQDAESQELDALLGMARAAHAAGAEDVEHMNGAAAAFNYIRIADLVASSYSLLYPELPVLDWGCGYGQVSWLLRRRSVNVESCDAEKRAAIDSIPQLAAMPVRYMTDPVQLPYDSKAFSAVLSVGVLEHVPDLKGSLQEIHRVLRPKGLFFLFMFPNQFSWAEWTATRRGISAHPYKFTFRQTEDLLFEQGFQVEKSWRRNLLPKNLTGFSPAVKSLYGKYYRQIETLDRVLCSIPPISWFSGVLELVAKRD
ncbi:MAG TPA: class I SAM-dependent methyltransferase [Terriglobia bacterium]|nr:class I SAM-dependent methyltransferase [Terriglobia bacterium]